MWLIYHVNKYLSVWSISSDKKFIFTWNTDIKIISNDGGKKNYLSYFTSLHFYQLGCQL